VELKTGNHFVPQKNHVFQLAAYCHLLEENYEVFVPYGVLVYNNQKQYRIPFDPKIRFELENTIKKMRYSLKNYKFFRNHNDINRCLNCSMKKYCSIKIILNLLNGF
jgi:CRISPR/Cas system-associated exonuclease Cas4 (RecB family)